MQAKVDTEPQRDLFNLKHISVELVSGAPRSERSLLTIAELEAMRTKRAAVPASKHGLETICGASGEIGAY